MIFIENLLNLFFGALDYFNRYRYDEIVTFNRYSEVQMTANIRSAQMREKVEKLFLDAGYSVPELLDYIDAMESERARMSEELNKLRLAAARRAASAPSMNSRLK